MLLKLYQTAHPVLSSCLLQIKRQSISLHCLYACNIYLGGHSTCVPPQATRLIKAFPKHARHGAPCGVSSSRLHRSWRYIGKKALPPRHLRCSRRSLVRRSVRNSDCSACSWLESSPTELVRGGDTELCALLPAECVPLHTHTRTLAHKHRGHSVSRQRTGFSPEPLEYPKWTVRGASRALLPVHLKRASKKLHCFLVSAFWITKNNKQRGRATLEIMDLWIKLMLLCSCWFGARADFDSR